MLHLALGVGCLGHTDSSKLLVIGPSGINSASELSQAADTNKVWGTKKITYGTPLELRALLYAILALSSRLSKGGLM